MGVQANRSGARETISSQIWSCVKPWSGRLRRPVSRALRMGSSQRALRRSSRSASWLPCVLVAEQVMRLPSTSVISTPQDAGSRRRPASPGRGRAATGSPAPVRPWSTPTVTRPSPTGCRISPTAVRAALLQRGPSRSRTVPSARPRRGCRSGGSDVPAVPRHGFRQYQDMAGRPLLPTATTQPCPRHEGRASDLAWQLGSRPQPVPRS